MKKPIELVQSKYYWLEMLENICLRYNKTKNKKELKKLAKKLAVLHKFVAGFCEDW